MGEAKRRFAALVIDDAERQHMLAAAQERMAAGRPGFAPDLSQALMGLPGFQGTVIIFGVGFVSIVGQDEGTEACGFIWADLDGRGDAKYAVSVVTQQTEGELLRLLENAEPDEVGIRGKLDGELVTGDSGETFRRILGEVITLPRRF